MRNRTQAWPALPPNQREDLDLQSRIKRRDPLAMGDLYDRYGKLAYTLILRIVLDQKTAEDLLEQTFIRVWNQVARWRDSRIEDLRLWVLLLARQSALDHLRSRDEPVPPSLPRLSGLTEPATLQDFPRPRNNEEWKRLRNAFASLNDHEAGILEKASFDGRAASEIALGSGETLGSIKQAIRSALAKLSAVHEK